MADVLPSQVSLGHTVKELTDDQIEKLWLKLNEEGQGSAESRRGTNEQVTRKPRSSWKEWRSNNIFYCNTSGYDVVVYICPERVKEALEKKYAGGIGLTKVNFEVQINSADNNPFTYITTIEATDQDVKSYYLQRAKVAYVSARLRDSSDQLLFINCPVPAGSIIRLGSNVMQADGSLTTPQG